MTVIGEMRYVNHYTANTDRGDDMLELAFKHVGTLERRFFESQPHGGPCFVQADVAVVMSYGCAWDLYQTLGRLLSGSHIEEDEVAE